MAYRNPDIERFLQLQVIAVVGVSRREQQPGRSIYRRLKEAGYKVYAVNPAAENIDGDRCFPDLESLPEKVEGVVVATSPKVTDQIIDDCIRLKIPAAWIHRSFGSGSISEQAVRKARQRGMMVIAGACPMMFCPPVDLGHKCIKFVLRLTGRLTD